MDRLPGAAARLVEQLGALRGVTVERVQQEHGRWVVRAVCGTTAARDEALAALARIWPRGERSPAVHVELRVG